MTKDDEIITLAVRHLIEGNRTLYVTPGLDRMRQVQQDIVTAMPAELIGRVYLSRGDEHIRATNGTILTFHSSRGSGPRGLVGDVLLLDGVSDKVAEDALPILAGSRVAEVHRWP